MGGTSNLAEAKKLRTLAEAQAKAAEAELQKKILKEQKIVDRAVEKLSLRVEDLKGIASKWDRDTETLFDVEKFLSKETVEKLKDAGILFAVQALYLEERELNQILPDWSEMSTFRDFFYKTVGVEVGSGLYYGNKLGVEERDEAHIDYKGITDREVLRSTLQKDLLSLAEVDRKHTYQKEKREAVRAHIKELGNDPLFDVISKSFKAEKFTRRGQLKITEKVLESKAIAEFIAHAQNSKTELGKEDKAKVIQEIKGIAKETLMTGFLMEDRSCYSLLYVNRPKLG